MVRVKIRHERSACIGCGACAAVAPDYWEMMKDGKSDLKDAEHMPNGDQIRVVDDDGQNQDAADACPVPCIFIERLEK